ncbi:MAG: hypothetical protein ACJAYU_001506 [Bradymonadia bacterium]|jgi:hypothetical protein
MPRAKETDECTRHDEMAMTALNHECRADARKRSQDRRNVPQPLSSKQVL